VPGHDIVTIGASAGGVEALTRLVRDLPADLPASIFVVLHVPAHGVSLLPQILSRKGPLSARHPTDGERIEIGRIYVAPPDLHMLIKDGRVRLSVGPRENGHRPAVDPLFRSAAAAYGPRVVGVILSGILDDGTAGLMAVKERGGSTIVQHPDEALYAGMPRSALENVEVEHSLPVAQIAPLLTSLAHTPVEHGANNPMPDDELELESEIAAFDLDSIQEEPRPGTPSGFACPDCGGSLFELRNGEMVRFRCRVGHAWSPTSLLAEQSEAFEYALWTAFRALEERAVLATRLADRMMKKGQKRAAVRFREQAEQLRLRAGLIRQVLVWGEPKAEVEPEPVAGPPEAAEGPQANESGTNEE
jgi:two-component system, chemotaxis family, protein-glutamate methylesterase/glutaminase